MTERAKVTVITPVKNILNGQLAERFLNCVFSVANQTYPSIEHLVVDGNSDDGTAVILTTQPSIRYETYPSISQEDAMNYGISKATGDYILFLNAGDALLEDTAIEKMVQLLEENKADFVYGPSICENSMGVKNKEDVRILYFFIGEAFQFQSCLLKREIFEKIGKFNTSFGKLTINEFVVKMFINGFYGVGYKDPLVLFFRKYVFLGKFDRKSAIFNFLNLFYKDFPAYSEEKIHSCVENGSVPMDLYNQILDKVNPNMREELEEQLENSTDEENIWPKFYEKGYRQLYIPVHGVGDALTFQILTKALFEKTGHKVLVGYKNKSLFENNHYVEVTDLLHEENMTKAQVQEIEKAGLKVIFLGYYILKECFDGKYRHFYPNCHLITRIANICGLEKVDLRPILFLSDKEKEYGRFAPKDKKQVAIMSGGHEKYRVWPYFQDVVDAMKDEVYFVQIGAKNDVSLNGVSKAVNGEISLRQTASVLYNSDLFVGEIGGLMHMARAVDCPAVVAYSSGEPDYFVNYIANTNVHPKDPCYETYSMGIPTCSACLNRFKCIRSIDVKDVIEAIREKLKNPLPRPLPVETVQIKSDS